MNRKFDKNESLHYEDEQCVCCPRCSSQKDIRHETPQTSAEASTRSCHSSVSSLNRVTMLMMLILSFAITCSGSTIAKDECDPKKPNACSFGAVCQKDVSSRTSYYRCTCPKINCFQSGLMDLMCGTDGTTQKVYFNSLCLIAEQCVEQQPIKVLCKGRCGTECDESSTVELVHTTCPEKDFDFCVNGGLCIHHQVLKESSCTCPEGFSGTRCEVKELETKSTESTEKKCNSRFEILVILAIILLSVVLIAIIVCLCLRQRKSEDNKLWPHYGEKDEKTPLRESARTEFTFPESHSQKGSSGN